MLAKRHLTAFLMSLSVIKILKPKHCYANSKTCNELSLFVSIFQYVKTRQGTVQVLNTKGLVLQTPYILIGPKANARKHADFAVSLP